MMGLTRCVLPPGPCLFSKFRFDVLAHLSPGESLSSFIPMHMLHPHFLHSTPASPNILPSPSASALLFTSCEPGTTRARTSLLTWLPLTTRAASVRSESLALVHDPMKTVSRGMSVILVPGARPMYFSARSRLNASSFVGASLGDGMLSVTPTVIAGFVPQLTCGSSSERLKSALES